jgi:hypothetical protein
VEADWRGRPIAEAFERGDGVRNILWIERDNHVDVSREADVPVSGEGEAPDDEIPNVVRIQRFDDCLDAAFGQAPSL